MKILGVHLGHDAGAALLVDGRIAADAQEERFVRVKHSSDPPFRAVQFCLKSAGLQMSDLDVIAISGQKAHKHMPVLFSLNDSDRHPDDLPVYLERFSIAPQTQIRHYDHHHCHAAASYYLSGEHSPSLVLVSDGFGDDCAVSLWRGQGPQLSLLAKFGAQGSLGWFYSNLTEALGWIHGDGEGKTMALASAGDPGKAYGTLRPFCPHYQEGRLAAPRAFGSIGKLVLQGSIQWHLQDAHSLKALLEQYTVSEMASAAQAILEEEHLEIARYWLRTTGLERLCLGGGVFLNIILNRRLADLPECRRIFIFPNPGDSGLALGAALAAAADLDPEHLPHHLQNIYLGPEYSQTEIKTFLDQMKLDYQELDQAALCRTVAEALAHDRCVGWFQGRMESGPRALGNRSILMSPAKAEHKDYLNRMVKFREPFRPFCPSLLAEERERYVLEKEEGPYMIMAFRTPPAIRKGIQAVVHVDDTIRPQIVTAEANPLYHQLLRELRKQTGLGIVLNTSFNVRGEPIILSPADAVRCFYSTGMDMLALGHFLLQKGK